MDNKVLEILLGMQQDMKNMQHGMKNMQQGMENIQQDVKNLQQDVKNMQQDIQSMKQDIKDINTRLDKIEFKMNDGFETLEILSENNSYEMTKVKIQVAKVEKRVKEISMVN